MSQSIPGPDLGACPQCGGWRKAGMRHNCDESAARLAREVQEMVDSWLRAETHEVG